MPKPEENPGNQPANRGPGGPERDESGHPVHPRGKVKEEEPPTPPEPDPQTPA